MAEYKKLAEGPGAIARQEGDAAAALAGAARVLEADYEFPYLAHAPMEPLDCVAQLGDDGCDIWTGSQIPTVDQASAAAILGLKPEKVRLHTLFSGGRLGRRGDRKDVVRGDRWTVRLDFGGKRLLYKK